MKKNKVDEKSKTISLRLPQDQYEKIVKISKDNGYISVSDYIRDTCSKKKKSVKSLTKQSVSYLIASQDKINALYQMTLDNPESCNDEVCELIKQLVSEVNNAWQL